MDYRDSHADLPAPEGPMSSIFKVGNESSDAMDVIILEASQGKSTSISNEKGNE